MILTDLDDDIFEIPELNLNFLKDSLIYLLINIELIKDYSFEFNNIKRISYDKFSIDFSEGELDLLDELED